MLFRSDSNRELDALVKLPEAQRKAVIERAIAGEDVKATKLATAPKIESRKKCGRLLGKGVMEQIIGTCLDSERELKALHRLPVPVRNHIIERVAAGEHLMASDCDTYHGGDILSIGFKSQRQPKPNHERDGHEALRKAVALLKSVPKAADIVAQIVGYLDEHAHAEDAVQTHA